MNSITPLVQLPLPFIFRRCSLCGISKIISEFSRRSDKPSLYRSACKLCTKQRAAIYYRARRSEHVASSMRSHKAHPETYLAACRRHYLKHRERLLPVKREYYQRTKDAQRLKRLEYCVTHAEAIRETKARRYTRSKDVVKMNVRAWQAKNPDKVAAYKRNRRARLAGAKGQFCNQDWEMVKARYGYTCLACGKQEPLVRLTVDHVIPLAVGGVHHVSNIQPLCRSCNSRKNARVIDYRSAFR